MIQRFAIIQKNKLHDEVRVKHQDVPSKVAPTMMMSCIFVLVGKFRKVRKLHHFSVLLWGASQFFMYEYETIAQEKHGECGCGILNLGRCWFVFAPFSTFMYI